MTWLDRSIGMYDGLKMKTITRCVDTFGVIVVSTSLDDSHTDRGILWEANSQRCSGQAAANNNVVRGEYDGWYKAFNGGPMKG